jgi:hypothetical protein
MQDHLRNALSKSYHIRFRLSILSRFATITLLKILIAGRGRQVLNRRRRIRLLGDFEREPTDILLFLTDIIVAEVKEGQERAS